MSPRARFPRTILVPLDGSPFAERALPVAVALVERSGGTVRLAMVHQSPAVPATPDTAGLYVDPEPAMRKAERAYLRETATRLGTELGRTIRAVLLEGEVAETLRDHAAEVSADLVVTTTHGRGPVERAWLGSVADRLMRTLDVPLLVVTPPDHAANGPAFARILVPLDGSTRAEEALEHAAALARLFEGELLLVQVVAPAVLTSTAPMPSPPAVDASITASLKDAAQDYLDSLAERLREEGVRATAVAVLGDSAAGVLLELARPERVDLVAMATHARSGLPRMVLGSVTDKLVRACEPPVLVCRPGRGRRG